MRRVDFLRCKYNQHFCVLAAHHSPGHLIIFSEGSTYGYPKNTLYTILDQEAVFFIITYRNGSEIFLGKVELVSFLCKVCPIDPVYFRKINVHLFSLNSIVSSNNLPGEKYDVLGQFSYILSMMEVRAIPLQ